MRIAINNKLPAWVSADPSCLRLSQTRCDELYEDGRAYALNDNGLLRCLEGRDTRQECRRLAEHHVHAFLTEDVANASRQLNGVANAIDLLIAPTDTVRIPYRPLAIGLVTVAFSALLLARAQAGDRHFFAPVAGGIGVTPFLAWLDSLQQTRSDVSADLHYCTRDRGSDPFVARLEANCAALPGIRLHVHGAQQGETLSFGPFG